MGSVCAQWQASEDKGTETEERDITDLSNLEQGRALLVWTVAYLGLHTIELRERDSFQMNVRAKAISNLSSILLAEPLDRRTGRQSW